MEERLCYRCQEKIAGAYGQIEFQHKGITFSVFKDRSTCSDCKRKSTIESFEEYGADFIRAENGEIRVDWKKYVKICNNDEEMGPRYTVVLVDIGILSMDQKGNWEVSTDIAGLNPRPHGCCLFFTNEADVRAYAKERYAGTMYSWVVRQFSRIITKEEVCG
jgi:hypothetical protein